MRDHLNPELLKHWRSSVLAPFKDLLGCVNPQIHMLGKKQNLIGCKFHSLPLNFTLSPDKVFKATDDQSLHRSSLGWHGAAQLMHLEALNGNQRREKTQ